MTEGKDKAGESRWTEKGLCSCSIFDQTQATAILRSGWKRGATRVLISYREESPYLEITAGDRLIIAGTWETTLLCEGKKLQLSQGWRRTWWEVNENATYLEISVDVQGGWRLERSILLLPKDKVVLLSEAVIVPDLKFGDTSKLLAEELQLQSTLSVSPAIDLEPCEETREVFGCDNKVYPPMSEELKSLEINFSEGYEESNFKEADLYIIGNAISKENKLLQKILKSNKNITSGPKWLHDNILSKKKVIAVSGTHGKTTVTSMISHALSKNGISANYLIAGIPNSLQKSWNISSSELFVIEADEYDTCYFDKKPKFFHYNPNTCLLYTSPSPRD